MLPSLRPFGERSVYLSPYSAHDSGGIRIICDMHPDTGAVESVWFFVDWPAGQSTVVAKNPAGAISLF